MTSEYYLAAEMTGNAASGSQSQETADPEKWFILIDFHTAQLRFDNLRFQQPGSEFDL